MDKLIFILLFAFSSLIIPMPQPVPDKINMLEKRDNGDIYIGNICPFHSYPVHDAGLSARRENFSTLASVFVVPVSRLVQSINTRALFRGCDSDRG
jgi:hypothetical protein